MNHGCCTSHQKIRCSRVSWTIQICASGQMIHWIHVSWTIRMIRDCYTSRLRIHWIHGYRKNHLIPMSHLNHGFGIVLLLRSRVMQSALPEGRPMSDQTNAEMKFLAFLTPNYLVEEGC